MSLIIFGISVAIAYFAYRVYDAIMFMKEFEKEFGGEEE